MASRFDEQKPDPAIRQNIRRARAGKQPAKDIRALIVAASLTVTLGAWGLFAHQDTQALIDAQAAVPPATVISAQAQVATLTPTVTAAQAQATVQPQAATTTTGSPQQSAQAPVAVARTRSSQ
jgi:hypothetical protein